MSSQNLTGGATLQAQKALSIGEYRALVCAASLYTNSDCAGYRMCIITRAVHSPLAPAEVCVFAAADAGAVRIAIGAHITGARRKIRAATRAVTFNQRPSKLRHNQKFHYVISFHN